MSDLSGPLQRSILGAPFWEPMRLVQQTGIFLGETITLSPLFFDISLSCPAAGCRKDDHLTLLLEGLKSLGLALPRDIGIVCLFQRHFNSDVGFQDDNLLVKKGFYKIPIEFQLCQHACHIV